MLLVKGNNLLIVDADNSNRLIVLEHRHGDHGANAAKLDRFNHTGMTLAICFGRCQIGYLNWALDFHCSFKAASRCRLERDPVVRLRKRGGHVMSRYKAKSASLLKMEGAEFGFAEPRGVPQEVLEDRLQIAGRAANDLKHL